MAYALTQKACALFKKANAFKNITRAFSQKAHVFCKNANALLIIVLALIAKVISNKGE